MKRLSAIALVIVMLIGTVFTGCGNDSLALETASEEEEVVLNTNLSEIPEMYGNTAMVFIPYDDSTLAKQSESADATGDVLNYSTLNSVAGFVPEIETENSDITYFNPIFVSKDIVSITFDKLTKTKDAEVDENLGDTETVDESDFENVDLGEDNDDTVASDTNTSKSGTATSTTSTATSTTSTTAATLTPTSEPIEYIIGPGGIVLTSAPTEEQLAHMEDFKITTEEMERELALWGLQSSIPDEDSAKSASLDEEDNAENATESASGDATEIPVIVKINGQEIPAFTYIIDETGFYDLDMTFTFEDGTTYTETYSFSAKNGSYIDDVLSGNETLSNVLVNKNSSTVSNMLYEYEDLLPLVLSDYIDAFDTEDEAVAEFMTDNENTLKEFNRLRAWLGLNEMSVSEIKDTYYTEEKIALAKANMEYRTGSSDYDGYGKLATTKTASTNTVSNNKTSKTAYASYTSDDCYSSALAAFSYINSFRNQNGLASLSWDESAYNVALVRANELVSSFSHSSASGTKTNGGENIALTYDGNGYSTACGWYNSASHRANMLNASYVSGAVACVNVNGTFYWCSNFCYSTDSNGKPVTLTGNTITSYYTGSDGLTRTVQTDSSGNKSTTINPKSTGTITRTLTASDFTVETWRSTTKTYYTHPLICEANSNVRYSGDGTNRYSDYNSLVYAIEDYAESVVYPDPDVSLYPDAPHDGTVEHTAEIIEYDNQCYAICLKHDTAYNIAEGRCWGCDAMAIRAVRAAWVEEQVALIETHTVEERYVMVDFDAAGPQYGRVMAYGFGTYMYFYDNGDFEIWLTSDDAWIGTTIEVNFDTGTWRIVSQPANVCNVYPSGVIWK